MATVKKGLLSVAGEWWRHLRPFQKRKFWKKERRAAKKDAKDRAAVDAVMASRGKVLPRPKAGPDF